MPNKGFMIYYRPLEKQWASSKYINSFSTRVHKSRVQKSYHESCKKFSNFINQIIIFARLLIFSIFLLQTLQVFFVDDPKRDINLSTHHITSIIHIYYFPKLTKNWGQNKNRHFKVVYCNFYFWFILWTNVIGVSSF